MDYPLDSFTHRIERSQYIRGLDKGLISKEVDYYYNHITFLIKNLVEYIQVITAIASVHQERFSNIKRVYRGTADSDWKLVPSLARNLERESNSYYPEYDMVSEMISEKPNEFKGLSYNLEILAKMQHYGLPTRLLDFSYSPLIALYFACSEKPSKSGRVVIGESRIFHFNEPVIEAICSLHKVPDCFNLKIDDWLVNYDIDITDYLRILYADYNTSLAFVKPLYINERMRIQQSVFAVFANELTDLGAYITYYGRENNQYYNEEILKYEKIGDIYHKYINMHGKPHFLLTSESRNTIWDCYKNADHIYNTDLIKKIMTNRFALRNHIRMIEPNDIFSDFCSIIIDKRSKRSILNELAKLGIDNSFVYPELEYTAEKVKKNIIG